MNDISSAFRILLIEDEPNLAFNLKLNLETEGYDVTHVADGKQAIAKIDNDRDFNLLIIDVMIPEPNGFQIAKYVRSRNKAVAIIMLTARATNGDRIHGLEIGVDDYINKPFHLQELLLRVRRALERSKLFNATLDSTINSVAAGPFTLDTESLELSGPTGTFSLTALEADVLQEFMANANRVLSREHLLEKVWHLQGNLETRTVDNFVMRLRRYLEVDPAQPLVLESVRGRGYRFKIAAEASAKDT